MSYRIEKNTTKYGTDAGTYRVVNTATGKVHSKHTTRAKAEAQVRLLHAAENEPKRGYRFHR